MSDRGAGTSIPKVWLVTGSSRGLGRALVEIALEAGDRVAATARNPERLLGRLVDYQPTIEAFAELVRAGSGHEATDPRRVAQLVRDLAGRDDAPLRRLLGADAVPMAQQAAQALASSDEAWRDASLSVSDGTPLTADALEHIGA